MDYWTPPWTKRDEGAGSLIVTSAASIRLLLDVSVGNGGAATWLSRWLDAYLARQVDGGMTDPDFCFFYVVLGDIRDSEPDGSVDGVAVLQAGYGGDPYGPVDHRPTTLAVLLREAIACLS